MKNKSTADDKIKEIEEAIRRDFGNRLTQLREQRNLTQPEMMRVFSETTPKSISGYSRWENGQHDPSLSFLYQLHKKWGVDLNELIAGDTVQVPPLPHDVQEAISVLGKFKRDSLFGK